MTFQPDNDAGHGMRFPTPRHAAILALLSSDAGERQRAFDTIATVYWRPAYAHIRLHWRRSPDDARDLIQGFFLSALEKGYFSSFDPGKARFRTFLRMCLDRFVQRSDAADETLKRGGALEFVPLDIHEIEQSLSTSAQSKSPEDHFHHEWVRALLSLATEGLHSHCSNCDRHVAISAFRRYDLEDLNAGERPTYEQLAKELNTTPHDITNQLAYARREFRRIVLELLREMTSSESEFQEEARELLGIDVK